MVLDKSLSDHAISSIYEDRDTILWVTTKGKGLIRIKDGKVISIPKAPFAWVDRPRSVNLLIGIPWLGSILYPDYYAFTHEDIREFYALFYHIDLTEAQINELLGG